MNGVSHKVIEDYVQYWETVNVRSVRLIERLLSEDVVYTDPFCEGRGIQDVERAIKSYFSGGRAPSIKVSNIARSQDGYTVFLRWEAKSVSKFVDRISGVSEVVFGSDEKVIVHHNFWDTGSQVMSRLPVLRQMHKWFKRRIDRKS